MSNLNYSSIIVKMSFTKGTFESLTSLASNDAAKIGKVAFLEPEIEILPFNSLFPLTMSFCI